MPSNTPEYSGVSVNYNIEGSIDPAGVVTGVNVGLVGTYTYQSSKSEKVRKGYGYLFSDKAYTDEDAIMDYHNEKESPFKHRDKFLPIPFSTPDYYSVTGEGVTGTFRAFWRKPGLFLPARAHSQTLIKNSGTQFHSGTNVGAGRNFAVGKQNLDVVGDWNENGNTNNYKFVVNEDSNTSIKEDEPFFFRFNNDLGGSVVFDNCYDNTNASLTGSGLNQSPNFSTMPSALTGTLEASGRCGRSSFIQYYKNSVIAAELTASSSDSSIPKLIPDYQTTEFIDRGQTEIQDHIGSIAITNEKGLQYVYGLPVYNRKENNYQFNIPTGNVNQNESSLGDEHIYANISNVKVVVGEEHNYSYPSMYLLTSIRSTDYADVNNNGLVDKDDYGGYTKFNYYRKYGNNDKTNSNPWFRWRAPYTGLNLSQGKLNDRTDDMGGFACGEREVYYLKSIETKTHIAVFVTNMADYSADFPNAVGSGNERPDGRGAYPDNATAANNPDVVGTDKSERLEKIMLYAKPESSSGFGSTYRLIKTIKFDYDYSIWPNSSGGINTGKLTLRKVWVENNNVVPAKVSPFEFEYKYPTNATSDYPANYLSVTDVVGFYDTFSGAIFGHSPQEPDYKANHAVNLDRWGNYQAQGKLRKSILNPWVDQTPLSNFDPAAWQLKQVKLPTGAEIHVQYEQDDYAFVQNRIATVMVPFTSSSTPYDTANTYELDLGEIYPSVSIDSAFLVKYHNFLKDYFNENNQYIYCKFLYKLTNSPGFNGLPLNANDCNTEYIDGYFRFNPNNASIHSGNNSIVIKLADGGNAEIPGGNGNFASTSDNKFPRTVCYDFVKTETGWQAGFCNYMDKPFSAQMAEDDPKSLFYKLLSRIKNKAETSNLICGTIKPEQSYVRLPLMPIPTMHGKKGGGLRIKRIMMYDRGLNNDSSDNSLYGTEYQYLLDDNITSSGVASNEPADGREESPLIDFIEKRDDQKWHQKAISGIDREQFEGPYGETILPAASVGYSRVVTKNIRTGKTDAGYSVKEYYTSKDFPYDGIYNIQGTQYNGVDVSTITKPKRIRNRPFILINIKEARLWAVQGYRFIINNMSGMQKSEKQYNGTNDGVLSVSNTPVYEKTFEYYQPGEMLPAISDVLTEPVYKPLGVESEIIIERRHVEDITNNAGLSVDAAIGFSGPFPVISGSGLFTITHNDSRLSTLVTNKLIYLPAVLKKTTEFKDGIKHENENVAFSVYNGSPVITRSADGFDGLTLSGAITPHDGSIYTYTQTAPGVYKGMSQKALNDGMEIGVSGATVVSNSTSNFIKLSFTGGGLPLALSEGDLLKVTDNSNNEFYFYVKGIVETPSSTFSIFLDQFNGSQIITYPLNLKKLKVIKSGKSNQLEVPVGNIVTYNKLSFPLTQHSISSTLLAKRQAVIADINNADIGATTPGSHNVNIYYNDADKDIRGGTGSCLGCFCEPATCSCSYRLWGLVLNTGELYVAITNPCHGYNSGVYTPPDLSGISLDSNGLLFTTIRDSCSPQSYPLLINYQHLGQAGGTFFLDPVTQYKVMYAPPGEEFVELKILDFCNPDANYTTIPVIANSATTFKQKWDYSSLKDYASLLSSANNLFNFNVRGKWRPDETYTFKAPRSSANGSGRNYNAGIYTLEYNGWRSPSNGDKWIKASDITYYSPNGEPLEQTDAINIHSSSFYTHDKTLPNAVASNADHNSLFFESFEQDPSTIYSGTGSYSWQHHKGHAGISSIKLAGNTTSINNTISIPMQITSRLMGGDIIVKFWATNNPDFDPTASIPTQSFKDIVSIPCTLITTAGALTPVAAYKVHSSGKWSLFEVVYNLGSTFSGSTLTALLGTTATIEIGNHVTVMDPVTKALTTSYGNDVYIDDIRYQPAECSMSTYVYEPGTRRLVTSFDDRHFGLFYLYNAEGKLVRKMVETERGIKMLDERQYNTGKKVNRPH